jgi:hypothetical protein
MLRGDHNFFFGNRSVNVQPIDIVRWLSDHTPTASEILHIRNIVLSSVIEAERGCPGGGSIAILVANSILNRSLGDSDVQSRVSALRLDGLVALSKSRRCRSEDAYRIMSEFDASPESLSISQQALRLCSSNASVTTIEESETGQTRVETVTGHKFPCHLPDVFLSASRVSSQRVLVTPRVIVIDGMVERMSEIEGVSGGSYRSRTPLVIFARGYSADVQNTLGANFSSGHLVALPLCVPYDEMGANLLGDISVVCGANPISSLKGELVSSRTWDELEPVDRVEVSAHGVSIFNARSKEAIKGQRLRLREKRKHCAQPEVPIIDRRLQCLTGEGVLVRIGRDLGDSGGIIRDRIDSHVRIFRSIGNKGTINTSSLRELRSLSDTVRTLSLRHTQIPSAALVAGLRSGISSALSLAGVGGIVIHDQRR